jgi:hypothetical protein
MIGADILILLFGLGFAALTWLAGRAALEAARTTRRNATIAYGAGTVILGLAAVYCLAEAALRLLLG